MIGDEQIKRRLNEVLSVLRILTDDVIQCQKVRVDQPSSFADRMWAHSTFVLIEGLTYQMRQLALDLDSLSPGLLTTSEKTKISEDSSFLDTADGIKWAIRTLAKAVGEPIPCNFNTDKEWKNVMLTSLEVRNRITHPKKSSELNLSEDEAKAIGTAGSWFFDQWNPITKHLE